jgi:hypothetical protein
MCYLNFSFNQLLNCIVSAMFQCTSATVCNVFLFTVEGDWCLLLRKATMFCSRVWWTFWSQACGQAWSQACGHHKVLSSFYNSHSLLINIISVQAFLHSDMQHLIGEGEPSLYYLIQPLTHPHYLSSLLSLCILPVPSSFSHLVYPVLCRWLGGIWGGSVCLGSFCDQEDQEVQGDRYSLVSTSTQAIFSCLFYSGLFFFLSCSLLSYLAVDFLTSILLDVCLLLQSEM